jgi:excisionase family DNA binding protein
MSSNLEIQRICEYCNKEFTARTTRTKYCSHKCNSRHYKAKQRNKKVQKSIKETATIRTQPIEVLKSKEFLSVQDVATILSCSTKTVYRLINDSVLKGQNLGERLTRVKRSDLNKLMELPKPQPEPKPAEPVTYEIEDCYTIGEVQDKYSISQSGLRLLLNRHNVPKIKKGKYTYVPKTIIDNLLT